MQPTLKRMAMWLAGSAMLAASVTAHAEFPTFEITPFVGARMGGGFDIETEAGDTRSVDLESGSSFGIDLGLYANEQGFYELLYSTQEAGLDSNDPDLADVDIRVQYLQFGGTAFFPNDRNRFLTYLSMTIGATMLEPTEGNYDSETKFSGSFGGGFRFPFNDRLAVSLGLRGYLTLIESDTDLFCSSTSAGSGCLVRSSGSTFFQTEGQLGFTFVF
jgi:hypothetical protein